MYLSDRLMKITEFVKENTSILDVGTDHGYVPIYIVEKGICKKVIASDVSPGSLNKTIDLVKKKGLENHISSRLGDGLDVIEAFEVDGVIMAGMGGILIQRILEKNKETTDSIDYFIFQPMVASKELRKYLSQNNYKILDEKLAKEDDKFYEIIYAIRGKEEFKKDIYYEISQRLIEKNHPLLKEFIEDKINSLKPIINDLKDKTSRRSVERYNELNKLLDQYREVLKEIET